MSAQHTPGEWLPMMERDQTGFRMTRNFVQCGDDILATVHAMGDSNDIDNTKLIAAAPDLLAALRWLRAFWRPGSDHDTDEVRRALLAADDAIAKVTGK